jgi:hypothetical protein
MSALAFVVAAIALGYALQVYNGAYADRWAMSALGLAMLFAALGVLLPRVPLAHDREERLLVAVGLIGLAYGAYALLTTPPGLYTGRDANLTLFHVGIVAATALAATALLRRPPLGRAHIPLLLVVHLLLGIWIVRSAPAPGIDVYLFHEEGLKALLAGRSPYSTTIANLYGNDYSYYYGPNLVVGGRVQVGHPYPPLSLLLALLGHLAGDYRYALVAAVTGAAALIAYLHAGRSARLAAVLLLFTPRVFFVYEQGWTEPFLVLTLAAAVFCAMRARRGLPFALAAFLASKQYALLAFPAVVLLFPRPIPWKQVARLVAIVAALAAVVTLPFVVWDPKGFINSVLLFQLRQPFRFDSLSLLAKVARHGSTPPGAAFSVVFAVAALVICLWRAPRTASGFAGTVTLTFLAFVVFAKQAFWNYYFVVLGGMACAVGATLPTTAEEDKTRSPLP